MKKKIFILILCIAILNLSACGEAETSAENTEADIFAESSGMRQETGGEESRPEGTPAFLSQLEERDALELEQLLDYSADRQKELSEITVNLSDEKEALRTMGESVVDALSAGRSGEALEIISADEWLTTMLPKLIIGQRNYEIAEAGYTAQITVIADELGNHCTAAMYRNDAGRMTYLEASDNRIKVFSCDCAEGSYLGEFQCETLDFSDGLYLVNAGTLSPSGVVTGTLNVGVSTVDLTGGVDYAWSVREENIGKYAGEFDEEGHTRVITPEELRKEGQLAYASLERKGGTDYLLVETEASPEDYIFYAENLGVYTIWDCILGR